MEALNRAPNGVRKVSRNTAANLASPVSTEHVDNDRRNPLPDREIPLCLLEPLPRRQHIDDPAISPNRHFLARLPVSFERLGNPKSNPQIDSLREIVVGFWIHRANATILRHTVASYNWIFPPRILRATGSVGVPELSYSYYESANGA